jgi:hypothetical protein
VKSLLFVGCQFSWFSWVGWSSKLRIQWTMKFGKQFDIDIYPCFYTYIQNQIIHKHVHMDYNPLKGMLILISSLKLSTVPYGYAASPEVEVTRGQHGYISMSVGFIITYAVSLREVDGFLWVLQFPPPIRLTA